MNLNSGIGNVGVYSLGKALRCNGIVLRDLKLDNNNITQRGACILAEGLCYNQSLQRLTLRYNNLSNFGIEVLNCISQVKEMWIAMDAPNNEECDG